MNLAHTATRAKRCMLLVGVMLAAIVVGFATPALAVVDHYDVRVDGLACPFCVRGVEKKLKALPGTTNVRVDLERGVAAFDVTGGHVVMPDRVQDAIRDAGFTPRGFTVRASGTVVGSGDDLALDVGGGRRLLLRGGDALGRLRSLVRDGRRDLIVGGSVTRSGDAWNLSVADVHERPGSSS